MTGIIGSTRTRRPTPLSRPTSRSNHWLGCRWSPTALRSDGCWPRRRIRVGMAVVRVDRDVAVFVAALMSRPGVQSP
jgi:hypothetical protein